MKSLPERLTGIIRREDEQLPLARCHGWLCLKKSMCIPKLL
jgi:hypothetical protein